MVASVGRPVGAEVVEVTVLTLHIAAVRDDTYVQPDPTSQHPPPWVHQLCPATEHPLGMVSATVGVGVAVMARTQEPTMQVSPKLQHAPPREEGQAYWEPKHLRGEQASKVVVSTVGVALVVRVVVVVRLKA